MAQMKNTYSIESDAPIFPADLPRFGEHSLLEGAVTEAARELQVSREMAMMCALGAMAAACQAHVDVQLPTGHRVPTSLMLLTIAESGERKTTTQKHFSEAILTANNEAYQANEKDVKAYRVEHELWAARKRQCEHRYRKFAAQEEEDATRIALDELTEHLKVEPQPPQSGKFVYEDTTPPALVQMLHENTPNGCLLTSEANSIFSGKALSELDKLNTLWDGGDVIVDRISREGFILKNARLTLALMAQPSVITTFMSKRGVEARGTGFLARFLIIKPHPMAGQRRHEKLSSLLRKEDFNCRVQQQLSLPAPSERQILLFSEEAADLWYGYSQQLEQEMQENNLYYYLKDHASKLLENASRLAAILHTFERQSDTEVDINAATLKFCWEFARVCSRHFIEQLASEPQIITDANNLAHYLIKKAHLEDFPSKNRNAPHGNDIPIAKKRFTLTEIKQYGPSSLRGRANSTRLEAAVELLIKLGHVAKEGGQYRFQETFIGRFEHDTPSMKNGEFITIKELPLFSEQEYRHDKSRTYGPIGEFRIKTKREPAGWSL